MAASLPGSAPSAVTLSIMPILCKRFFLPVLLCAFLLFGLSGCRQSYEGSGRYVCTTATDGEYELDALDSFDSLPVLQLEEDGSGNLSLGDVGGLVSWRRSGSQFVLKFDGREYVGSMDAEGIRIRLFGSELSLHFVPEATAIAVVQEEKTESLWQGDWYGWWRITEATGDWEAYDQMWTDCFFQVLLEDGQGSLLFWDEDTSREQPLAALDAVVSGADTLTVIHGSFLGAPAEPEDWQLTLSDCRYPQLLELSIPYADERGSFTARLCLRPWGELWEDVAAEEPELLPFFYENWYKPYVQAGSAMPAELELPE